MKIIMDPADEFESITIHDAIRHVGVEETMKTSNNHKKLFMNSDEDFNTFSESAAAAALFTKSLSPSGLSAQQQQQQQQQHSKQEENEINMLKDELNNEVKNSNIDVTINNNYYDNANAAVTISADSSNSIFDMKSQRYVTPQDFDLLKVIGMGAFGKVLQVKNKQTKKVLAMKVISKRLLRHKTSYIENVQAEREILNKVNHPFIVTMHCSFQTREKLFIIMDFLAGGELFLKLGREGIFTENTAAFYISEIVLALEHLHSKGILHRDLKPENILLSSDGHLCLTDFGLAKDFQWDDGEIKEDGKALTVCGTQEYMAPEMVARKGYGKAADWWSLGCIAYEMFTGTPPFESKKGAKDLFRKIMNDRVKMPDCASASTCVLLKGLLNRNAMARFGAAKGTMFQVGGVAQVKCLAFFSHIDWNLLEQKKVEPPETLEVDNDEDLRHFYDEFTSMGLPRSVLEMNKEDFKPRRCQSGAFRGFSFIQEDFELPERTEEHVDQYWNNIEEDGESQSDCASSIGMNDDANPGSRQQRGGLLETDLAPTPEVPAKKKRPPRKKKKKKQEQEQLKQAEKDNQQLVQSVKLKESDTTAMLAKMKKDINVQPRSEKKSISNQTSSSQLPDAQNKCASQSVDKKLKPSNESAWTSVEKSQKVVPVPTWETAATKTNNLPSKLEKATTSTWETAGKPQKVVPRPTWGTVEISRTTVPSTPTWTTASQNHELKPVGSKQREVSTANDWRNHSMTRNISSSGNNRTKSKLKDSEKPLPVSNTGGWPTLGASTQSNGGHAELWPSLGSNHSHTSNSPVPQSIKSKATQGNWQAKGAPVQSTWGKGLK